MSGDKTADNIAVHCDRRRIGTIVAARGVPESAAVEPPHVDCLLDIPAALRVEYENLLRMLRGVKNDIAAALTGDRRGSAGDRVLKLNRGAALILRYPCVNSGNISALLIDRIGKTAFCVADRDALVLFLEYVVYGLDDLCFRGDTERGEFDRYGITKPHSLERGDILVFKCVCEIDK